MTQPAAPNANGRPLLFVEQFYYPEGWGGAELPRDLTMHLARAGHRVEVVCGKDLYAPLEGDPGPDPASAGVRIRRIPRVLTGAIHSLKLLRQVWFYLCLLPLIWLRRPPVLYIAQTNPPLALVFIAMAAAFWRRPLLIIAMDIYPEVIVAHGVLRDSSVMARLLAGLFRWAYRRADAVVSLGPVMTERLQAKGVAAKRIHEIPNWSTGAPGIVRGASNGLRREWDLAGKFVLLYSGNLGVAHEFDTLLDGFSRAAASLPELRLLVIGKGRRLDAVKQGVERRGLGNLVQFRNLLPAARMPEGMGLASVALVTLQPGFEGLVVPSKLQGYMARGVPVFYIGPRSDSSEYISRAGCGLGFETGDAAGFAAELIRLCREAGRLELLGERARAFASEHFCRQRCLAAYERLIHGLLNPLQSR